MLQVVMQELLIAAILFISVGRLTWWWAWAYLGMIITLLATPVGLGSLWALIPEGLAVCGIVVRTALEDKTLLQELDGYREYAAHVRYRLLPGIW